MVNAKAITFNELTHKPLSRKFDNQESAVIFTEVTKTVASDDELLKLYEERSEAAISETAKAYGAYCTTIAMNILHNAQDAEECVNDAYFSAWEAIPPHAPSSFSSYLGKITRNLALDKHRKSNTKKRGGGSTDVMLSELEQCLPSARSTEDEADANILSQTIDSFLSTIREEDMTYFVCRYWHTYTVAEIADKLGVGQSKVKTSLHRTRKKLKTYLGKRGIIV
ncbi:MAG: sigma-70 family RNA polymerase sigma factor [Oscillospiraceae bacterium]|nr:sigma-70 family RNA polymerase sigma factor [Oscillospiraceae bacterium]